MRRTQLKRGKPLQRRTRIKQRRTKPRRGRVRDPKFLRWLHQGHACIVPGCQNTDIEAAHIGARGFGTKCDDREAAPMCGIEHHREGPESHHKLGRNFWSHHGIDRDETIARLNREYESEGGGIDAARIYFRGV
jgi:hypothetical protein